MIGRFAWCNVRSTSETDTEEDPEADTQVVADDGTHAGRISFDGGPRMRFQRVRAKATAAAQLRLPSPCSSHRGCVARPSEHLPPPAGPAGRGRRATWASRGAVRHHAATVGVSAL